MCNWLLDFLTSRPQHVRLDNHCSSTITINTGVPQGCVMSPFLYSLLTHDCRPADSSNTIIKFADDTTVIGLIKDSDEAAYREEVDRLAEWCDTNNLLLNTGKTKELIFLGVHISEDLTWTTGCSKLVKKAHQRLFFLRTLRKNHLSSDILVNFYRCTIESILTSCITVWYGSCSAADRKALQRVVKAAQRIAGAPLPSIEDIYRKRCLKRAGKIIKDSSHPAHRLFTLLPSGKRYRSARTKTTSVSLLSVFSPIPFISSPPSAVSDFMYLEQRVVIRGKRRKTENWLLICGFSVWISMPIPVLGLRDHSKVFKDGSCLLTDNNFVLVGSFVAFFVPLTIMVVTYFLTINALQNEATLCLDQLVPRPKWSTTFTLSFLPQTSLSSEKLFRRSISREAGGSGSSARPGRRPWERLRLAVWTPHHAVNQQRAEGVQGPRGGVFSLRGHVVSVLHHQRAGGVNPLVYTLFNKTYRAAFLRYVRCQYQPEKKPLQLILVNTIPPLAYSSTQLPLSVVGKLRNGATHSGGEAKDFSLPGQETEKCQLDKSPGDKDESC
ncbi:hypothetical protein L3Q82_017200, partial [Scortum barcoo]